MTREELILKIEQETYHLRKMFESCKTEEQIQGVNRLACFLIGTKWSHLELNFSLHESIKIHDTINDSANDLELFYRQAKKRVKDNKNNKIRTGYWD